MQEPEAFSKAQSASPNGSENHDNCQRTVKTEALELHVSPGSPCEALSRAVAHGGTRCEQREEEEEFGQHESDPYSSRHVQPNPLELKVCLRRLALACRNTFVSLSRRVIPQIHACAPVLASYSAREHTITHILKGSIAYARYRTVTKLMTETDLLARSPKTTHHKLHVFTPIVNNNLD